MIVRVQMRVDQVRAHSCNTIVSQRNFGSSSNVRVAGQHHQHSAVGCQPDLQKGAEGRSKGRSARRLEASLRMRPTAGV